MFSSLYTYFNYSNSTFNINEFVGIIHPIPVFISPNIISFSMHTPGIIGLPRRIFDYPIVYFRFHRLGSFGIIGIAISSIVFFTILVLLFNYSFTIIPLLRTTIIAILTIVTLIKSAHSSVN